MRPGAHPVCTYTYDRGRTPAVMCMYLLIYVHAAGGPPGVCIQYGRGRTHTRIFKIYMHLCGRGPTPAAYMYIYIYLYICEYTRT